MLYHLCYPLRELWSPFNVFQYITFRSTTAFLTALILSLVLGPPLIRALRARGVGQRIRTDGPRAHLSKEGTPTMGGLLILASLLLSTLLWARWDNRFTWLAVGVTVWLGAIGFVDDYLKHTGRTAGGMKMDYKLWGQVVLGLAVAVYLYLFPPNGSFVTKVNVPYLKDVYLDLRGLYVAFALMVLLGTSNGVNLTDGLDGLAVGAIAIAALTYGAFAYLAGHAKFSAYLRLIPVPGAGELAVYLAAMAGAAIGFLWYNAYPAEVFMGDTGSLFLGGGIGLVALCVKQELLLLIVGGLFLAEVLSVLLQVASFRLRDGKRILRMAPLHHHFELGGWAEPKVVVRFWIVAVMLALVAVSSLKVR